MKTEEELKALYEAEKKHIVETCGLTPLKYDEFLINQAYLALSDAIWKRNIRAANQILDDYEKNIKFIVNHLDKYKQSFLHWAGSGDVNIPIAKRLINLGIELDGLSNTEETPLTIAAKNNSVKMVELLLQAGADVNVTNFQGLNVVETVKATIRDGFQIKKEIIDLLESKLHKKVLESTIQVSIETGPATLRENAHKITLAAKQMLKTADEMLKTAAEMEKKLFVTNQKQQADSAASQASNSNSAASAIGCSKPLSFQTAFGSAGQPAVGSKRKPT